MFIVVTSKVFFPFYCTSSLCVPHTMASDDKIVIDTASNAHKCIQSKYGSKIFWDIVHKHIDDFCQRNTGTMMNVACTYLRCCVRTILYCNCTLHRGEPAIRHIRVCRLSLVACPDDLSGNERINILIVFRLQLCRYAAVLPLRLPFSFCSSTLTDVRTPHTHTKH